MAKSILDEQRQVNSEIHTNDSMLACGHGIYGKTLGRNQSRDKIPITMAKLWMINRNYKMD